MATPTKYPLLRNLIAFQIGVVVASVAVCILVYYVATRSQIETAILDLKKDLAVQLAANQEKWRAWQYLSLDKTLETELNNFAKVHSLASLVIKQRPLPQNKIPLTQIILPEEPSIINGNLKGSDLVVIAEIDTSEIYKHYSTHGFVYYFLFGILIIFIFLILFSGFYLYKYFYLPIWSVLRKIQNSVSTNSIDLSSIQANGELKDFINFLSDFFKKYGLLERQSAIVEIASQVSHDIRSPLAALKMATDQLTNISEDKRILIRSSVSRINDISNELLSKGKELNNSSNHSSSGQKINQGTNPLSINLLSPLIDSIVSEKRIQFREKQGVEIEADLNQGYGLFAEINATELKRTVSNLITNAVEALPNNTGKVIVAVKKLSEAEVSISIKDNGKGIPENILKKLGEMGVSHGKEGTQSGSGLGIYHAKKTVEASGGQFIIQSREGAGTTISMIFKKSKSPKWFVEKLNLSSGMFITSLDDDISIHQIWKGRFESKNISSFGIVHNTYTAGVDFKEWVTSQSQAKDSGFKEKVVRLYLVDYELLNQSSTGLDIIEELGIGKQSILVTSRYEEDKIRERCDKLGVKLIPKAMAGFVPIEIEKPKELFDAILIDDDSLPHLTWQMVAKEKSKNLLCFVLRHF
jgi:signal transduction histidine kinase